MPSSGTSESRMMNAVQLQMINVSVKTLRAWINPCFTGWETAAVAAAFGADPIPASFEKSPRRTPCMTIAPNPPPANCSNPNAFVKIEPMTWGNVPRCVNKMKAASRMYAIAIRGTMIPDMTAIRCIPPNMTSRVNKVKMIPSQTRLVPKTS